MDGHFNVPDSVSAGQVPDGIPGQKQDHFGLPGCLAQVSQGALLIG